MNMSLVDIIYDLPANPKTICLRELFGNDRPIELEIGTGKGGFLLQQARAHEDRNYLGIEWANKYFKLAADRMARWGVGNVRMIRCDAKVFVQQYLPAASISALHVHHPDPWPKRRHHRRRLFDEAFVDAAAKALADGGVLDVQTDHAEYFEQIRSVLRAQPDLEETLFARQNQDECDDVIATNFQIKYQREGREIYRLTYRRRPR
ncbi:MAG: tRNA (guanosine(46)-N7)-methyltransferase TrmB [Planctomycetes bacterium]|nr:tRNA (guanosine(46)-N7)-methyltransferase TrmB [Planctomycetota bacterium]